MMGTRERMGLGIYIVCIQVPLHSVEAYVVHEDESIGHASKRTRNVWAIILGRCRCVLRDGVPVLPILCEPRTVKANKSDIERADQQWRQQLHVL